jgi:hypothetical protein
MLFPTDDERQGSMPAVPALTSNLLQLEGNGTQDFFGGAAKKRNDFQASLNNNSMLNQ